MMYSSSNYSYRLEGTNKVIIFSESFFYRSNDLK